MLLAIAAILAGFALLIWSSDKFVDGASAIAVHSGISPLIVGLTIVGFGTSAPEMLVSGIAAFQNNPGLGIGNAIGSNITNIGLILGVTALLIPLRVNSRLLRKEIPVLLAMMTISWLLVLNNYLGVTQGLILFALLGCVMVWIVLDALKQGQNDAINAEFEQELAVPELSMKAAVMTFIIGLLVLLGSARLLVWGAVDIAHMLGISDLIIGLTVVAIGTSLPELAASIQSARKGEHDIAIGNVIGSNLFNILGVMALPGLIAPSLMPDGVLSRDFPVMLGMTILLLIGALSLHKKDKGIGRLEGGILLAAFIGYELLLFNAATI